MAVINYHLSLQRCQLHIRETLCRNVWYFCFIEFYFFDLHTDLQTEKDTSEPMTTTCPTASTFTTATSQEKKKAIKPLGNALNTSKRKKGMLQDPPGRLNTDQYPRQQNFVRMPPAFFYLIKECKHHHLKKSAINFKRPLELGHKLAIMLRHLTMGETYTSLLYQWLFGPTTICEVIPQVIIAEFQEDYLICNTDPED